MSTGDPPGETAEEVRASKRKLKPTMKAQALLDIKKCKQSKKQATKKQQQSSVAPTVAVLPQTTAWILTPAGLVPVAEIQFESPGIPENQKTAKPNNVQMIFQQPIIVNQSSFAVPNDTRPSNSAPDLPADDIKSLPAGSDHGQNHTPSQILQNNTAFLLPSSSNSTNVLSASVKYVPQVPPDTNAPSSNSGSITQDPPSKCNQNKTSINVMSTLVPGSSTPVGTNQINLQSSSSDATNNVPRDSSVSALTSTPSKSPVLLNNFGFGTILGAQSQTLPHIVPQVLFQQPIIVNQNGSLALIDAAGPCTPNNYLTITANTKATDINKSPPTSTNTAAKSLDGCLNPVSAQSFVLNKASLSNPQSSFVNSPVGVSVGSLSTDQTLSSSSEIGRQVMMQQMASEGNRQTFCKTATMPNSRPQVTFDPSLMFFEQPAQVKTWLNGNDGITLPGLKETMPYLPPFVSSINTLSTLLKGRDSLLNSAVQLLPEKHRENSEEEAKIAAVRKMVSERFQNNKAYMLLKARFLSCFTLPALLATINPVTGESANDLAQEDNNDKDNEPGQFEEVDQLEPLESLFNTKESDLPETELSGS
ncbi:snRNA-activating protein complex subunit 4 [Bagarius yarrelli]|uniref:snRNA-activating protein complex subunit 4 n=1 Tax=Bagarius yarrelli TaxID=175774 RepID=A0A556U5I0_BAGYA|nr:snRNA-activating protein complex subunit 4 [Bagarius yarrelli]